MKRTGRGAAVPIGKDVDYRSNSLMRADEVDELNSCVGRDSRFDAGRLRSMLHSFRQPHRRISQLAHLGVDVAFPWSDDLKVETDAALGVVSTRHRLARG